ncbi:hypothetical protein D3C84_453640 [compost metagenome]
MQHDRQLLAHLPDRIQETEHQHQHDEHQLEFTGAHVPHVPQPQAFETEDGRHRCAHGDDVPHQQVRQQTAHPAEGVQQSFTGMTRAGAGPTQTQQPQHADQRGQQAEGDGALGQVVHHASHRLHDGQFVFGLGNPR